MSEFDWKKKAEQCASQLKSKKEVLKEYKKTIDKSTQLIQDLMKKLSLELQVANQIHQILLPTDLPVISNCEFSFKFRPSDEPGQGKDFYEVVPHSKLSKSFGIILSSCFSHSLSALLVSARLKMMSHSKEADRLKPHEFVRYLVDEMSEEKESFSSFPKQGSDAFGSIDLFYARVDQKTYEMSYCLVGDITVLVWQSESGEIQTIKPCMKSVDFNQKAQPQSGSVFLNGKDRLVICSPGILQAKSPAGESYSLASLKNLLKTEAESGVHELRNFILYELKSFCQGRPSQRDQSVLVMEVKNRILKLTQNK